MAFRVLSIDGGGMRGIYTAAYLAAMEQAFANRRGVSGLDIGKGFDLIAGTSTGAIIGCALANDTPPQKIVDLYKKHGRKIFRQKLPKTDNILDFLFLIPRIIWQTVTRGYFLYRGEISLRDALVDVFGETTIEQVFRERGILLAIPAVKMETFSPHVFKTPHNAKSDGRDNKYTLVDVCLASSAAPLFRSLAVLNHPTQNNWNVFADGGMWANNPVLVALIEALRYLRETKQEEKEIEIYCLGTCPKSAGNIIPKWRRARGLLGWKFGGEAAQLSLATQESAFTFIVRHLVPHLTANVKIITFPTTTNTCEFSKFLELDETRKIGLNAMISKAQVDASKTNSDIQCETEDGLRIERLFQDMPERVEPEPQSCGGKE